MNNKNKILIGCLSLLLVLSVGYALFSETITINGTATAKGNFEITTKVVTDSEELKEFLMDFETGEVVSSNIEIVNNVITTNATLGRPGSSKMFVIEAKNTGSIPAYLKDITDENGNPVETSGGSSFAGKTIYNADRTTSLVIDLYPDLNFGVDYVEDTFGLEATAGIESVREAVLDPGERTFYYIEYVWPSISTSGEEITGTLNVKLIWEQVTAN